MPGSAFQPFGATHWSAVAAIALTAAALGWAGRSRCFESIRRPVNITLAVLLLGHQLVWWIIAFKNGVVVMPLHLCDLALFAAVYSLFRHNQIVWELAYFWGLAGTVQAVLTPDLKIDFPHPLYFRFFFAHGMIDNRSGLRLPYRLTVS